MIAANIQIRTRLAAVVNRHMCRSRYRPGARDAVGGEGASTSATPNQPLSRRASSGAAAADRQLRPELSHVARQPLRFRLQFGDRLDRLLLVDVQHLDDPRQRATLLLGPLDRAEAGPRLDSADALRDAALGDDDEGAD